MRAFGSWMRRQGRNLEWMRGVRECRVRFLEFEVGNDNIAVAAVGRERKPALGFPRFPPPAISTAGLAGRMLLPLPATSALANVSRLSYPHETAKNPFFSSSSSTSPWFLTSSNLSLLPSLNSWDHYTLYPCANTPLRRPRREHDVSALIPNNLRGFAR